MYSILIPSKNRHLTLIRQLKYISNFSLEQIKEIIILDSSNENLTSNKNFKSFDNKTLKEKINYIRFDENVSYPEKMNLGTKKITSEKCLLISDDDFVNFEVVQTLNNKLDSDDKIIYVTGNQYLLNHNNSKIFPLSFFKLYREFESNMHEDIPERIKFYLKRKSIVSYYGIFKSEYLKKIWKNVRDLSTDFMYQETFFNIYLLYYGKALRLPVFYSARQPNIQVDREKYYKIALEAYTKEKVLKYFDNFFSPNKDYSKFINKDEFLKFFEVKKPSINQKNHSFNFLFKTQIYRIIRLYMFKISNFKYIKTINKISYYFLNFDTYNEIKKSRSY